MVKVIGLLAAAAALPLATPAAAATIVFGSGGTVVNGGMNFTTTPASVGTGSPVNVHVTAWTLGSSALSTSHSSWPTFTSTTTGNFASQAGHTMASLGQWAEGLGVQNSYNDVHTADNSGSKDYLLLQFSAPVTLQNATFLTGWGGMNDTDATISHANITYAGGGDTYNNAGAAFWTAAGQQLNSNQYSSASFGQSGDSTRNINSLAPATSNVWLIGANIADKDFHADGFKLNRITYTHTSAAVPEPATWAMLILGMGMVGGTMRRRNRAAVAYA